jgi:rhamnogalacturonyl hydrolase YesR
MEATKTDEVLMIGKQLFDRFARVLNFVLVSNMSASAMRRIRDWEYPIRASHRCGKSAAALIVICTFMLVPGSQNICCGQGSQRNNHLLSKPAINAGQPEEKVPINHVDEEIMSVVIKIADRIMEKSQFDYVDTRTGKIHTTLKNIALTPTIRVRSEYNDWQYWNGVLHLAFISLSQSCNDAKYLEHVARKYRFLLDSTNLDYFSRQFQAAHSGKIGEIPSRDFSLLNGSIEALSLRAIFRLNRLDDCGAMGAALIDIYNKTGQASYLQHIERFAEYIKNRENRLDDGTLARIWPRDKTLWADDLFMSVPFMVRYALLKKDSLYLQDAVDQVLKFNRYLFDTDKGLYRHCYYADIQQPGVAFWGRANGWVLVAQTELLRLLPDNHPQKAQLIQLLRDQIRGLTAYQSPSGCWHQLLDKDDSYLESSCTAMFIYGIAKAVNMGWVDQDYAAVAEYGWQGLLGKMDKDFQVKDICIGTGTHPSLSAYYSRPTQTDDIHGLGAILLAGIELAKLKKYSEEPWL